MNEQFAAYLVTILVKTIGIFVFFVNVHSWMSLPYIIVVYVLGLIVIVKDHRRK